ncbi:MAG: hypothetical protein JSW71_02975 [Gemmatimonadota bacterium]|nr:MAG: hypothetical protein JSW71_02975 [Gemmatimonadota bacterium]
MLVAHTISDSSPRRPPTPLVRRFSGLLTVRHPLRYKLVYDDRGRVIGRIVAPQSEEVFGVGRGAVFLTRD